MPTERTEIYEFGSFRLDVGEHKVARLEGTANGSLPEKAFRTLIHLVRNRGTLVSHDELFAAVWPNTIVEKNNLGKAIHVIRTFLGDTGDEPHFIETIPKHGYRFIADVTRIEADELAAGAAAAAAKRASRIRSPGYDLYIRGRVKVTSENPADNDEAIRLLEAAVDLDPLLAEAFALLARAYNTRAFKFSSSQAGMELQCRAEIALQKAFDLDADLADAHFARGLIVWTSAKGFPHEHAIRSFKRSLQLDPNADETHHQLSMVLAHIGLLDEAQAHVGTAVDINPNNSMARFRVAAYTAWRCRFDEALAILKTVPRSVSPMLVDRTRAEVLVQLGRIEDARVLVDKYLDRHPADEGGSFTGMKALLAAKAGRASEADAAIARAIAMGKGFGHFHHTAYNIASACAALIRPDDAVAWLEEAADDGFPCYPYFEKDPNLDCLRGHPRFTTLMSSLHRRWDGFRESCGSGADVC